MTTPADPNHAAVPTRVPLTATPLGARARLVDLGEDSEHGATLEAMGLTSDEEIVVHKTGEPTIVSLNCGCGRRIGLSRRVANSLRVEIIRTPPTRSEPAT